MYIFRSMDVYILAVGVEGIHILRPDDACVFGKIWTNSFFRLPRFDIPPNIHYLCVM